MKKIIEVIMSILLAIVYPHRILNIFKVKNLDQNSNRILGNDKVVKIIAFVIAIVVVIAIRYTPGRGGADTHQRTLSIPLGVYIDEGYTYWGSPIPANVDIILSGDITDVAVLDASGGIRAYIDLRGLDVGLQDDVIINVEGVTTERVAYVVNPTSTISGIEIDSIELAQFQVESLNAFPDLDVRYEYSEVVVHPEYVTVVGPSRFVNQIDAVRAAFEIQAEDLSSLPTNISRTGVVIAHDAGADTVRGVEFDPTTVDMRLQIYEDSRSIRIEVNRNLLNAPRNLYEIIDVVADINEIQVWGDFDNMEDIIQLPRINFNELNDEGQITIPIELPDGVFTEVDDEDVRVVDVVVTVTYEEVPLPPPNDDDDDEDDDEDEDDDDDDD